MSPGSAESTEQLLQVARDEPNPTEQITAIRNLRTRLNSAPPSEHEQIGAELTAIFFRVDQTYLKSEVLQTLAICRSQQAEDTLVDALENRDAEVRKAACEAFAKRKTPRAIQALDSALNQENDLDVRLAAAMALGEHKGDAARDALARSLRDSDVAVQLHVMKSLQKVTGQPYMDVDAWNSYLRGQPRPPTFAERSSAIWR